MCNSLTPLGLVLYRQQDEAIRGGLSTSNIMVPPGSKWQRIRDMLCDGTNVRKPDPTTRQSVRAGYRFIPGLFGVAVHGLLRPKLIATAVILRLQPFASRWH